MKHSTTPSASSVAVGGVRQFFRLSLRAGDVQAYRVCDAASGVLLVAMILFSPWAYGTTQPWSVTTMNLAGYIAGLLLAYKIFVRYVKGFPASRWDDPSGQNDSSPAPTKTSPRQKFSRAATSLSAVLTILVLLFCFASAWNARGTYHRVSQSFYYYECIQWLPHSLDNSLSWQAFWNNLAIACAFWSLRDWLLGRTPAEERALRVQGAVDEGKTYFLPARLRLFLWILCINGALLGIEGVVQRMEGSGKLLFIAKPRVNPDAVTQFGPWAYRANASAYFNMVWPVCLGFWWMQHRAGGFRRKTHHLLLVCAAVMAACPIISTSRGGAAVSAGILIFGMVFLVATDLFLFARRSDDERKRRLTFLALAVFVVSAVLLGYFFGWKPLAPRMSQFHEGIEGREAMFDAARPMAADYPWFGTGPGTFEPVFQLYRASTETYWPAQLHNDWLETRITFGWVGLGMILAMLVCVVLRWYAPGGIHGGRRFVMLTWLALGGCLAHARFDFPFQIYSTLFLFVMICSMLFCLTRRPGR